MTTELTDETYRQTIQIENVPVVVDFHATWCGPCKAMAPILDEINEEYAEEILIVKLDVDNYPEIAKELGIQGMPTLVMFKKGEVYKRIIGARGKEQLLEDLELENHGTM